MVRLSQTAGQFTLIGVAFILPVLIAFATKKISADDSCMLWVQNAEAARLAGIPPRVVTFSTFVFCSGHWLAWRR